jgi:ferredoxin-type protein NapH
MSKAGAGEMRRQRVRRALLYASFFLFPVTYYYLSPVVSVLAAQVGVVSGSLMMFGLMLVSSVFFGRAWCGWACPAGGLQLVLTPLNNRPTKGGRWNLNKYLVWAPWLLVLGVVVVRAGGLRRLDFTYSTWHGISMHDLPSVIIGVSVVAVFVTFTLLFGRRGHCHYICWMAPFMIAGRAVGNALRIPSLRLAADTARCTGCRKCNRECPMSLDVNRTVQQQQMEDTECVLCATCIDGCPSGVIRYRFGPPSARSSVGRARF